jgi:membrane associated rhomboid family serine protease
MLIPYSTDAPVYHWPWATAGLIIANVVIFAGVMGGAIPAWDNWLLWYGDGLRPLQWIMSIFMHGGPMHLIGNMLFLWVFGLVVEGKLGWSRFLACYLVIGIGECFVEQAVMLGYNGDPSGSLGASAAIFGLIAMAAVWAPKNDIRCLWGFSWFYSAGDLDIPILGFAALYGGLELLFLVLSGGSVGSSWFHLGGMAIGFPLAVVLLKSSAVDCEGWDLFTVLRGEHGSNKKEPEPAKVFAKLAELDRQREKKQLSNAGEQLAHYLSQNNPAAAMLLYEKMKQVGGGWTLARGELLALIKFLHAEKRWKDSAPLMAEFIDRFPDQAEAVRVKLAQICVVELERPGKALDLLAAIDIKKLPAEQARLAQRITAKAKQMQDEGTVEFDTDAW